MKISHQPIIGKPQRKTTQPKIEGNKTVSSLDRFEETKEAGSPLMSPPTSSTPRKESKSLVEIAPMATLYLSGMGALIGSFIPTTLPLAVAFTGFLGLVAAVPSQDPISSYNRGVRSKQENRRDAAIRFLAAAGTGAALTAGMTYGLAGAAVVTGLAALGAAWQRMA